MLTKKLKDYTVILASGSPRRHFLLGETGLEFEIAYLDSHKEEYPPDIPYKEIPVYLAREKAKAYSENTGEKVILITADTIVWLKGEIIGKPGDYQEAVNMLRKLSGKKHEVLTGVCISSKKKEKVFCSKTEVFFRTLTADEINYYIEHYKPFDKAGAYGIQEWIGYVGIEKIVGSYYNVMGLPVQQLYHELEEFVGSKR